MPVYSFSAAIALMDKCISERSYDYIDGIMYAANMGVIVVGKLTDSKAPGVPVQRFSRWRDPWFYHHAHAQVAHRRGTYCDTCGVVGSRNPAMAMGGNAVELVPVEDYFFRYDRGSFWLGGHGWPKWATTTLTGRFLFNHWSHTAIAYSALHHGQRHKNFIIQDLAIPRPEAVDFLNWTHENLHLYPLWLCPIKGDSKAIMQRHPKAIKKPSEEMTAAASTDNGTTSSTATTSTKPSDYILNIGLWGLNTTAWPNIQLNRGEAYHSRWLADNRAIEAKIREVGGLKWLYAMNFYEEGQFWQRSHDNDTSPDEVIEGEVGEGEGSKKNGGSGIYDKAAYDELRIKYGAASRTSTGMIDHIPNVWEKVKPKDLEYSEGPGMISSMLKATFGVEHLLGKAKRPGGKSKKDRKRQEALVVKEGREGLVGKSEEQVSVREDEGKEFELV